MGPTGDLKPRRRGQQSIQTAKQPIIGYLHTGMEKTGEELNYFQGPTNTTRMDYLSPLFNELVFSLTTEKLIGIEVPDRAKNIRILMTELNRISSHLVALATGGMDIGALSMMIFGFRERELVLNFFEKTTGLRMNHNYIRPGGVAADLPDGWQKDIEEILKIIPEKLQDYDDMLLDNPIWKGRLQNVGILTTEECFAYGVTGPSLRASGHSWDLRKAQPYSGIENFEFKVPVLNEGDVFARWRIKVLEIFESLAIVEQAMNNMPKGPYKKIDFNSSCYYIIRTTPRSSVGLEQLPSKQWVAGSSPAEEAIFFLYSNLK